MNTEKWLLAENDSDVHCLCHHEIESIRCHIQCLDCYKLSMLRFTVLCLFSDNYANYSHLKMVRKAIETVNSFGPSQLHCIIQFVFYGYINTVTMTCSLL